MAPFDSRNGHDYILIKPDLVLNGKDISRAQLGVVVELESRAQPDWNGEFPVVTGRETYMEQVNAIKTSISTGAFQKAVLSRIRVIEGSYIDMIPRLYQVICRRHPNAFVYLFKSEDHFWMGASPEPASTVSGVHPDMW